jgi:anti-sigma factor RsiW
MHPAEQELIAYEDGELGVERHGLVRAHLAECTRCHARVRDLRVERLRTTRLLAVVDHAMPAMSVDAVIASARSPARWRPMVAAAITLFLMAAVAAAAVPGSALRRYLARVSGTAPLAATTRAPSRPARTLAADQDSSGIGFMPASRIDIVFRAVQTTGTIRITLRDSQAVRIAQSVGHADYTLTATGAAIENAGSRANYSVLVPRTARDLVVRIGSRRVFAIVANRIVTAATQDSSGSYVVAFARPDGENGDTHTSVP